MVTRKESLDRHKRSVHEGIKYPCNQCEYLASRKEHLDRHKRLVHEGIKFPCGQCKHQQH